jgi:hypothetical protein
MPRKKRARKQKCLHCKLLFAPDPRTKDRQKFCSEPECKRASKAWRQRRWLKKPQNREYFSGPEQVARTQEWRKEHPGYSKGRCLKQNALQDDCSPQVVDHEGDAPSLTIDALQDDSELQAVLLVGLIASLTGGALQDDIASSIRMFHSRGQGVFAMKRNAKKGDENEDQETVITSRASASSAGTVQLGGSSVGSRGICGSL